jgi:uncharacterized phosphosugar-binding protein
LQCLDEIERDLPHITHSAEAAARVHVEGGPVAISGDASFIYEGFGRSGGLMSLGAFSGRPDTRIRLIGYVDEPHYSGKGPKPDRDSDNLLVIAFGRSDLLRPAIDRGAPCDFIIDSHPAEHNGLFQRGEGEWVVPTAQNANIAALWVWTGEFVAACTRLGKMPLMFESFAAGGRERALRLGCPEVLTGSGSGSKELFHEEPPEPVAPGVAGRAYLRALRAILKRLQDREMANIRRAATIAAEAKDSGHVFYLFPEGHAISKQQRPCNTGYWVLLSNAQDLEAHPFQVGDAVLHVGGSTVNPRLAAAARAAGATFMTSFSSCTTGREYPGRADRESLRPDELYIDQHWPFGDAVVQLRGYDITILPPSGVVGEAVVQMITAEVHTILTMQEQTRDQP